jgi:hypothetical protein
VHQGPFAPDGADFIASPPVTAPVTNRDQFHVYGIELCPDGTINWYLDAAVDSVTKKITGGTLLHTVTASEYGEIRTDGNVVGDPLAPFDDDLFIQIELLLGGGQTGIPSMGNTNSYDAPTSPFTFPFGVLNTNQFEVDYTRYYRYR